MKKAFISLILILALLAGCGGDTPVPSPQPPDGLTAAQLLHTMLAAAPEGAEEGLSTILPPEGDGWLHLYGLDPAQCADYAIARLGGARVFELMAVRLAEGADARQTADALEGYLTARQGDFTGYAPDQARLAEKGDVARQGDWLALIISEDSGAVAGVFRGCLSGEVPPVDLPSPAPSNIPAPTDTPSPTDTPTSTDTPTPTGAPDATPEPTSEVTAAPTAEPTGQPTPPPTPEPTPAPTPAPTPPPTPTPAPTIPPGRLAFTDPGIDDMSIYDTSAILAAWESGDESRLSDKDRTILRRCREIIGQEIDDGMSQLEREWAIYSWLTRSVDYDWTHYDPYADTPRESYEPYGPLVDGVGVCLGYATAFQLFMDLLDVECITVVGAAFQSREDHAWNMVRLDGEWYCVDATWDNGSGGRLEWCGYFNVTSQHMADTDHQWDYSSVPEATDRRFWQLLLS